MKTKYPIQLFSGLLLSSALFFTSCTKEAPVGPKENEAKAISAVQADAASSYVYFKPINYSSKTTGFTGLPGVYTASAWIEGESQYKPGVKLEVHGSYNNVNLFIVATTVGNNIAAIQFDTYNPTVSYYFKACPGTNSRLATWFPSMEVGVTKYTAIPEMPGSYLCIQIIPA